MLTVRHLTVYLLSSGPVTPGVKRGEAPSQAAFDRTDSLTSGRGKLPPSSPAASTVAPRQVIQKAGGGHAEDGRHLR